MGDKKSSFITKPIHKIKNKSTSLLEDIKKHPKAFRRALASFFVMGLGQIFNKQYYKAIPLFLLLLFYLGFEFFTSDYIYIFQGELAQYPAEPGGKIYIIRDYGGILSKGLWGLFTLGRLVIDDRYRGMYIKTYDRVLTWLSADRSVDLLGNGIIALVILSFLIAAWIYSIRDAYVTAKEIEYEGAKREGFKHYAGRIWQTFFAYIIMLPSLLLMIVFILIPFLFAFLIAFTNYTYRIETGKRLISWTGFDAFKFILINPDWYKIFIQIFLWTILWALISSTSVYVVGFLQALIVESKYTKGRKVWRLILIIPWALPAMISLMVFKNAFETTQSQGLVNQLLFQTNLNKPVMSVLRFIGLLRQDPNLNIIYWFSNVNNGALARAVVILVNLWLGAPYFMMLIIGILNTISKDYYEAAEIDGATYFQKFKNITLPMVLKATIPVIIMTFSFNFNNFGAIYFLTGGGPNWNRNLVPESMQVMGALPGQTDILISWIYKLSFTQGSQYFNIASVFSIMIFVIVGGFSIYNLSRAKSFWEED